MTDSMIDERRWWSKAILVGGVVAICCVLVGSIGVRIGLWPYGTGFMFLTGGAVLSVIGVFLGIIAYVVCLRQGLRAERSGILIGIVLGAVILAQLGAQYAAVAAVPMIHNISTDTAEPPIFNKLVAIREAEDANPLAYDAAVLAEQQQAAYPEVKTLVSSQPTNVSFNQAMLVLQDLGLEIVNEDTAAGVIEATATTFWFGFKDDVVVRIRSTATGSIVDVRSVSRVGQSDLGANAKRIREILNGIES
ncbi:MAG: hypothetical protein ACI8RT_000184 [Candidatus Azotimanducaceae bacterium]|mgnify:CR=1 FL=1|jgi:uncharacterized protein (DUF1499 family)|tara:strand:+ start:1174 stop:1920 length:747 start_codon:yes stop_codon:yes gene_type:complete